MKISIIVPIYKVEKYIKECIESVLAQKYSDYELILVDDGSPDNAGKICDEYQNDNRVVVIHKENGGLSDARNTGIEKAKGRYIICLDGDDYWNDPSFLESIHRKIELDEPDILLFGVVDHNMMSGIDTVSVQYRPELFSGKNMSQVLHTLNKTKSFPGAAWHVAVKKKMLMDNHIEFPKGMLSEDIDWLLTIFYHARKISSIENTPYVYRKNRAGSITSKNDGKHVNDIISIVQKWRINIESIQNTEMLELYKERLSYYFFTAMIIAGGLDAKNYQEVKNGLVQNTALLGYSRNKSMWILNCVVRLIGVRKTSVLLNRMYALRRKGK